MSWVHDKNSLRDFLSLVIVHAPDDFPEEDYLAPDEQLNLQQAFKELRNGVGILATAGFSASHLSELRSALDKALAAYQAGDDIKGAHLLQEFEKSAFGQGS